MKVIAVSSQKGGSGKTTLAAHLAVEAERQGAGPVVLLDTDPQGSLSKWWNVRASETPALVQADTGNLAAAIDELLGAGAELVIIDTPPAIVWTIVQVFKVADLIIIPVRPSPHDLAAAGTTVDLAKEYGKPTVFVVNGATHQARITGEAAIALSQHGRVVPTITHNRTAFAASMTDGRTVMEISASQRAEDEVKSLWEYLASRLDRIADVERRENLRNTGSDNSQAGTGFRADAVEKDSSAIAHHSAPQEQENCSSEHSVETDLQGAKS